MGHTPFSLFEIYLQPIFQFSHWHPHRSWQPTFSKQFHLTRFSLSSFSWDPGKSSYHDNSAWTWLRHHYSNISSFLRHLVCMVSYSTLVCGNPFVCLFRSRSVDFLDHTFSFPLLLTLVRQRPPNRSVLVLLFRAAIILGLLPTYSLYYSSVSPSTANW